MPLLLGTRNASCLLNICWNLITLHSYMQIWPKTLKTKMSIASCMFNIQKCMLYCLNQNVSADAKMYHTCLYVEHTRIYRHFPTQFWRSVSPSGQAHAAEPGSNPATSTAISGPNYACNFPWNWLLFTEKLQKLQKINFGHFWLLFGRLVWNLPLGQSSKIDLDRLTLIKCQH